MAAVRFGAPERNLGAPRWYTPPPSLPHSLMVPGSGLIGIGPSRDANLQDCARSASGCYQLEKWTSKGTKCRAIRPAHGSLSRLQKDAIGGKKLALFGPQISHSSHRALCPEKCKIKRSMCQHLQTSWLPFTACLYAILYSVQSGGREGELAPWRRSRSPQMPR